jgi:hypothetical protein
VEIVPAILCLYEKVFAKNFRKFRKTNSVNLLVDYGMHPTDWTKYVRVVGRIIRP